MAVKIDGVRRGSPAARLKIRSGDLLLSAGGYPVNDLLDYGFRTAAEEFTVELLRKTGRTETLRVKKGEYEEFGLTSRQFLMDEPHRCKNNCVFCFIDQLPKGLRDTLYLKDDDERLSYLFGNYITLTNLSEAEIGRIIEMRISPVNISVHTMNPQLRSRMMNNRFAGERLAFLRRLAAAGIELNCQIVLCRGINDGPELLFTLGELAALYPAVQSVAVVPAGLTGHRNGLPELVPHDCASARETLLILERFHREFRKKNGTGLVYPADEWYILAGRPVPAPDFYDGMAQLENGVGMLALQKREFFEALAEARPDGGAHSADLITGEAAADQIRELAAAAERALPGLSAAVHPVKNEFFGGQITVAGLVTGGDIQKQIPPESLRGDVIVIPASMLRSEGDLFLDGVSLRSLSAHYRKKIVPAADGGGLLRAMLGYA